MIQKRFKNQICKKDGKKEGFTLAELIVAMSVFIILTTIAVGVFIQTLRSQRFLIDLMAINNNAGLVLEQISREIRTGYNFSTSTGSNVGCSAKLCFINYEGNKVSFDLVNDRVVRKENDLVSIPISAPDVLVKNLSFLVSQENQSGLKPKFCNPWRVTVLMEVASKKADVVQTIPLQTTISSRVLPVEAPGASEEIIEQCGGS